MGKENACYTGRFRSAREKTRLVKLDFEKQLRQLARERRQLLEQKRNLGFEPLEPPVQKGFKRFFVLRDDVARSQRAAFFQEILNKINTVQYSDTREFSRRKRHRGRKIKVSRQQELKPIYEHEWQRFKLSRAQAFYFTEVLELSPSREWRRVYRFVEPWRFRLKIAPNLITEVRRKDFVLEKRLHEIDYYLERNFLEMKLQKLKYGYAGYRYSDFQERIEYRNSLKNKPLAQILATVALEAWDSENMYSF